MPKYGSGVHRRQVTGMGRERKMDGECAGALAQQESMPGTPGTMASTETAMTANRAVVVGAQNFDESRRGPQRILTTGMV